MVACGVCHSDAVVKHAGFGNSFPRVPGHEVIGKIVAIPDSEKVWKKGDLVGGPWHGGHDGMNPATYSLNVDKGSSVDPFQYRYLQEL